MATQFGSRFCFHTSDHMRRSSHVRSNKASGSEPLWAARKHLKSTLTPFVGVVKARVVAEGSIPAGTESLGRRVQQGEHPWFSVMEGEGTWLFVAVPVNPFVLLFHRGVFV